MITGLALYTGDLYARRMHFFSEVLPGVVRVAVLRVAGELSDLIERDLEVAARRLGIRLQVIGVTKVEDLAPALRTAADGNHKPL
jgi:hypothetical protein